MSIYRIARGGTRGREAETNSEMRRLTLTLTSHAPHEGLRTLLCLLPQRPVLARPHALSPPVACCSTLPSKESRCRRWRASEASPAASVPKKPWIIGTKRPRRSVLSPSGRTCVPDSRQHLDKETRTPELEHSLHSPGVRT